MKVNEARPFFWILSLLIALLMWFVFIVALLSVLEHGVSEYEDWELVISTFLGAISFSCVAMLGFMPKALFRLFYHGNVDDK